MDQAAVNTSGGSIALSRRSMWVSLLLYPSHTLPTALAPVLVAVGLALRDGVFSPLPAALAFLGSWLIHTAGILADNHELIRRHPSVLEHPELLAAISRRTLTFTAIEVAILCCLVGAMLAGMFLVQWGGSMVWIVGITGLAASLLYSCGPWPYARSGLAEPIFLLMFGVVAVAASYFIQLAAGGRVPAGWMALLQAMPRDAFLAGLPVGTLITNILIIDDIRDRAFDAAKGWRTGAVRWGVEWSRIRYLVLSVLAYGAPIYCWGVLGYKAWIMLPLLSLPWAVAIGQGVCSREDGPDLLPMTARASRLSLGFAVLFAIGLAASR